MNLIGRESPNKTFLLSIVYYLQMKRLFVRTIIRTRNYVVPGSIYSKIFTVSANTDSEFSFANGTNIGKTSVNLSQI